MARGTQKQESDPEGAKKKEGPRAGERLAEARRENKIKVAEIAKELHLDEQKVRELEQNDFDSLGAPVFAKGHLRKYAQLVGIDPDDVLTEYYQMNRGGPAPLVVSKTAKPRKELSPGPWTGMVVVFILVAAAYWWFAVRSPAARTTPAPVVQETKPQTESAPGTIEADAAPSDEPVAVEADEPVAVEADAEEATVEESGPEQQPVAEPDDGLLRVTAVFTGDCWTEISDADGRRLFFGLGKDGRTVEVRGEPPLNVLFGDANNVSIAVNGVSRPFAAAERRGKTARLTVTQP